MVEGLNAHALRKALAGRRIQRRFKRLRAIARAIAAQAYAEFPSGEALTSNARRDVAVQH
jgi:hypothetical protein